MIKYLILIFLLCSCGTTMQRTPRKQINKPETNQSQINKPEITKPQIRKPEPRLKSNMSITEQFNKLFDEKQMSAIQSKENSPEINKGEINKPEIKEAAEINEMPEISFKDQLSLLLNKIFFVIGFTGVTCVFLTSVYFLIINW